MFFFFNDTATTEIYTLSLHDALPISLRYLLRQRRVWGLALGFASYNYSRSEEHTSELQSLRHLVCRLLLEKKKFFGGFRAPTLFVFSSRWMVCLFTTSNVARVFFCFS